MTAVPVALPPCGNSCSPSSPDYRPATASSRSGYIEESGKANRAVRHQRAGRADCLSGILMRDFTDGTTAAGSHRDGGAILHPRDNPFSRSPSVQGWATNIRGAV
jgi:hypothetical protein